MTKEILDALLLYIDARIDEKASGDIQDVVRTIHLRDDLIRAAVAAAEQEVGRE
jgi:hypothetical protein